MKNEEIKLLGVDVKDIVAVLAVASTHNGRLVDSVRATLPKQSPDLLDYTDADLAAAIYATLAAKHKNRLVDYVRCTLLYQNPDFLGYTDDDFVLVRYNGEVEKLSLADYIGRLKEA